LLEETFQINFLFQGCPVAEDVSSLDWNLLLQWNGHNSPK